MQVRQKFDLGGYVPASFINNNMPRILGVIGSMGNVFNKDSDVDEENLLKLANIVKNVPQTNTKEEEDRINMGKKFYMKTLTSKKVKKIQLDVVQMRQVQIEGEGLVRGFLETVVDAPIQDCVAFEFIKDSREKCKGLKKKRVVEQHIRKINDHTQLYLSSRNLGIPGFGTRTFRVACTWYKEENGKAFWIVYSPTKDLDEEFPLGKGVVR